MIADSCYIACDKIYDEAFGWISCGISQPTLFIATEQDLSEVQTMMLAFVANVNEEHILNGSYEGDEEERVRQAAKIIKAAPLYVEELPDFSLQDVENKIKKNIRDHDIKYCFYDYLHSSMKILEEITRRSGGVKLREDNILFMISAKLKDICNIYGIFIMTATQLNGSYVDSETPDQNLLRGAKSIADRVDWASILLGVTSKDIESLQTILSANVFDRPTIKMSVYKNRRGRYKGIYLWCKADLGTCRIQPMFCTTYDYELVSMNDVKIIVKDEYAI
jgi:replicative DNA helicase